MTMIPTFFFVFVFLLSLTSSNRPVLLQAFFFSPSSLRWTILHHKTFPRTLVELCTHGRYSEHWETPQRTLPRIYNSVSSSLQLREDPCTFFLPCPKMYVTSHHIAFVAKPDRSHSRDTVLLLSLSYSKTYPLSEHV